MKVPVRQLERHLAGGLANAYLVAGAEPLLVEEALEQLREAARRAGFESRELHFADQHYAWSDLESEADNLSLFASRKIVEVRLRSPRPGDAGGAALAALAESADRDRLLIVSVSEKVDGRSAWVKSFEEHGAFVEVWPIERAELARWVQQRAAAAKLKLTLPAAELLAERVEGNLLAAAQEIRRLALTSGGKEVGEAEVLQSVADNSRFDVFGLTDAVLAGEAARAFKMLDGLRGEGVHPVQISWALCRELSILARLDHAVRSGGDADGVLARSGVWGRRQARVKQAAKRFQAPQLRALLTRAAEVDAALKGLPPSEPWITLTGFVMAMLKPAAHG